MSLAISRHILLGVVTVTALAFCAHPAPAAAETVEQACLQVLEPAAVILAAHDQGLPIETVLEALEKDETYTAEGKAVIYDLIQIRYGPLAEVEVDPEQFLRASYAYCLGTLLPPPAPLPVGRDA